MKFQIALKRELTHNYLHYSTCFIIGGVGFLFCGMGCLMAFLFSISIFIIALPLNAYGKTKYKKINDLF